MKSKRLFTMQIAVAVFATAISSVVQAADPPPLESFVPAGFDLTVRINVRLALDAESLEPIRERLLNDSVQSGLQKVWEVSGIDLLNDVETVVLAGLLKDPKKENGLMILSGRLDEESVLKLFQASPYFEETAVGDGMLYRFLNRKKNAMEFFAFLDEGVVAFGAERTVKESLLALGDDSRKRMIDNPLYRERLEAVEAYNLVSVIVLVPPDATASDPVKKTLLKSARALGGGITLDNGLEVGLDLAVLDSRGAGLWSEMVEGALALAQMIEQPSFIGNVARRVRLTSSGSLVSASLSGSMDEALDLLAKHPKLRGIVGR